MSQKTGETDETDETDEADEADETDETDETAGTAETAEPHGEPPRSRGIERARTRTGPGPVARTGPA